MGEAVHELDLTQHVGPVAHQLVHLQHHDLARLPVPHLQQGEGSPESGGPAAPPSSATLQAGQAFAGP